MPYCSARVPDAPLPRLSLALLPVISANPLRDITIMTWTFFLLGIYVRGFNYTMACALNLGAVLLASEEPIGWLVGW